MMECQKVGRLNNYVDYGSTNILGFYAKFTVIVNGD